MENYNKILVLENDNYLPGHIIQFLSDKNVEKELWFNFSASFHYQAEENMERLLKIENDTLVLAAPSFVGYDNTFDSYIRLFLKLTEQNKSLNVAILFHKSFYIYLLEYLSDNTFTTLKKEFNHSKIKTILEQHNIFEIIDGKFQKITYELLMENYFETNKNLGVTNVKIKATGEIYPVYQVSYNDENICKTRLVLRIPENSNNRFLINEIEKVN